MLTFLIGAACFVLGAVAAAAVVVGLTYAAAVVAIASGLGW